MYVRTVALIIGLVAALAALAAPASAARRYPTSASTCACCCCRPTATSRLPGVAGTARARGRALRRHRRDPGGPITYEQLADGTAHARYQAVVLATGLVYFDGASYVSALEASSGTPSTNSSARSGSGRSRRSCTRRRAYGLNSPTVGSSMAGIVGSLDPGCPAALRVPEGPGRLRRQRLGYQATPVDPASFRRSSAARPALRSWAPAPTRTVVQELVVTVDSNPWMIHVAAPSPRHALLGRPAVSTSAPRATTSSCRSTTSSCRTPAGTGDEHDTRARAAPDQMTALDVLRAATWQSSTACG